MAELSPTPVRPNPWRDAAGLALGLITAVAGVVAVLHGALLALVTLVLALMASFGPGPPPGTVGPPLLRAGASVALGVAALAAGVWMCRARRVGPLGAAALLILAAALGVLAAGLTGGRPSLTAGIALAGCALLAAVAWRAGVPPDTGP